VRLFQEFFNPTFGPVSSAATRKHTMVGQKKKKRESGGGKGGGGGGGGAFAPWSSLVAACLFPKSA